MTADSVARFKKRLAAIPPIAFAELKKEVLNQALSLGHFIKSAAPRGKTGKLAESVRIEPQELRVFVRAGGPKTTVPVRDGAKDTYDYANAVEFGTEHAPAHAFFYPSYRFRKKAMQSAIKRAGTRGVKKAARAQGFE